MADCSFEEIREEHLPEVLSIYNYYIQNSTATFHEHLLNLEEMRGIVFFDHPRYRSFLVNYQGRTAGYCLLTRYKAREAYDITAEVTIYLKPEYSGKNLGTEALRHLEQFARGGDIHSLVAVICGENSASIRLFEKNGYTKCAHYQQVGRKFGRLLDIVCFQKIIG